MTCVALISCSAAKLDRAAPAKELYQGQLFKLSRRYCELLSTFRGRRYVFSGWGILSAKHGLVLPEQALDPYDLCLGDLGRPERKAWGESTAQQIANQWGSGTIYRVLAGRDYHAALDRFPKVEDYFGAIADMRREDGKRGAYGIGLMKRDLKRKVGQLEEMHAHWAEADRTSGPAKSEAA